MGKFDYKKWITENKYGKNTWENLYEQGVADFEKKESKVKEQASGNAGSGSAGSGSASSGNAGSGSAGSGSAGSGSANSSNTGFGNTGGTDPNLKNTKKADLDKDGKLSSYEKRRGAAIEKNMKEYKAGRTQGNGNPLLPEQIFGMQYSSKPPKQESCNEMMSYYEQMGCGGIQEMYKEYYYANKKLMTKENGTGPYEYSNVMQEGDNPEQQGRLVSMMNYLSELAPSGCNEMAKIQEINGNFNLHENNINKKTTKRALKKIIKEELNKSLLNEQYSGEGCQSYLPTSDDRCQKCTTSQPTPYVLPAFGADMTGPQCQCCDDERSTGGEDVRGCLNPAQSGATNVGTPCPGSVGVVNLHHEPCCEYEGGRSDDPCLDPRNPEQPNCWYCKSDDCQQTGTPGAYATNVDASNAGFSLYINSAICNSSEAACGPRNPEPEECGCCCDYQTAQQAEQDDPFLSDKPILSPTGPAEPSPTDGCKPGSPTVPAVWSATKEACICTDPSKPYLIPGSTQPCKGATGPQRAPVGLSIGESKKLRKEIQKELFGR